MDELEKPEAAETPDSETATHSPRQSLLSEIGKKLVMARQARDEQLSIVVRKLKLRESHLQALEDGDWDILPDDVYALGFLRQYSDYLALDLNDEIQRIKHNEYILTRPLTFPDPPVAPSRQWAWIAGAAFIILFITFNILNQDRVRNFLIAPQTANIETADTPAAGNMDEAATDEPGRENGSIPAATVPTEAEQSMSDLTETGSAHRPVEPASSTVDASALAAIQAASDRPEDTGAVPTTPDQPPVIIDLYAKPALPAESGEPATAADNKPVAVRHFRFEAVTASVWLQIYLPDESGQEKGALHKEVLLQQGYYTDVTAAVDSVWITCGNPVAMRIKVDGQVQAEPGSLGAAGKVLRNYHFKAAR